MISVHPSVLLMLFTKYIFPYFVKKKKVTENVSQTSSSLVPLCSEAVTQPHPEALET